MRAVAVGVTGALAFSLSAVPTTTAAPIDASRKLRQGVTVGGILAHERVFQRIANNHGGIRASGTSGYDASARYVQRRLKRAGYKVRLQPFDFPFFQELGPSTVERVGAGAQTYESATMEYSGSGDVTGRVVPIDVQLPPPAVPGSTSGCEPEDFPAAGAEPAVALIQRGTCTFEIKATNAVAAGYDAVAIFNEGQEGRTELLAGVTLGVPISVPVVGLSFADGEELAVAAEAGEVQLRVATQTVSETATTYNVIADSRSGARKRTVVVGAHLDSVTEGAGINDNGSGSATILEIAEEMAELKAKPRQRMRFAFWGAEENGLLGSTHYVESLSNKALSRHVANLNFDMVGSPNYGRFVYDGNGSLPDSPAGPIGSGRIERIFHEYFRSQNLASEDTPFTGRSDYGPFIEVGIPAGGLFTGAEGIKTAEQEGKFGGTAGQPYDPCYHQVCDDMSNLNKRALREMSDAAAHAVWTMARTRAEVFMTGKRPSTAHRSTASSQAEHHGHAVR